MSITDPRLFGHDPDTGVTEWFHYDVETGGFVIEAQQDASSIIEVNRAQYNETERSTRYGDGVYHVSRFPLTVVMELAKQGIMSPACRILDHKRYRAWLNDPENQVWRVRRGRV